MELNWIKCQGGAWCKLNSVNLDHAHFNNIEGVYIIWHGATKPWTVYVGQGKIKDRLTEHRIDNGIQQYADYGLFVTWAKVPQADRDGVELYLAEYLQPLVGERYPDIKPLKVNVPFDRIEVNLPW